MSVAACLARSQGALELRRERPSLEYAAEKKKFGAVRRARWFERS